MTRAYNAEAFGHLLITMAGIKDAEFRLDVFYHDKCGCACGHAGRDEYFMQQGFVLKPIADSPLFAPTMSKEVMVPFYKGLWAMEAVAEFFGTTVYEACTLFVPSFYAHGSGTDRHVVLARIRYFCESNKLVLADEVDVALSARQQSDINAFAGQFRAFDLPGAAESMNSFARTAERLRGAFDRVTRRPPYTVVQRYPVQVAVDASERGAEITTTWYDEASAIDFATIERHIIAAMSPTSRDRHRSPFMLMDYPPGV